MSQVKPTILVTGGAGYIGSHAVLALQQEGYRVLVLDNLEYGHREFVEDILTDYPTPDGTCLRDYIHVSDLATAHILGLEYLLQGGKSEAFNLGNGNGFSVRQVIETARLVTDREINVVECDRRSGDPSILVGGSDKAQKILGWSPQYTDLSKIIGDAWQWHQRHHQ